MALTDRAACSASCDTCQVDVSGDGARNGDDISVFTACLLEAAGNGGAITEGCLCADMPAEAGLLTTDDIGPFVTSILEATGDCP